MFFLLFFFLFPEVGWVTTTNLADLRGHIDESVLVPNTWYIFLLYWRILARRWILFIKMTLCPETKLQQNCKEANRPKGKKTTVHVQCCSTCCSLCFVVILHGDDAEPSQASHNWDYKFLGDRPKGWICICAEVGAPRPIWDQYHASFSEPVKGNWSQVLDDSKGQAQAAYMVFKSPPKKKLGVTDQVGRHYALSLPLPHDHSAVGPPRSPSPVVWSCAVGLL